MCKIYAAFVIAINSIKSKKSLAFLVTVFFITALFAQPTITSFSPLSGNVGTTVTITGTNFNSTAANDIVFFGATKATVSSATTTSLTVTVPSGATYAPITVLNTGTNLAVYSRANFNPVFSPNKGGITNNDFAAKTDLATGTTPYTVAIGDIDGDGKPDLVITNYSSNNVSVLLNTGSSGNISFAAKADFITGLHPYYVVIGDIDGDGKPDLSIANINDNSVSVLRNTSTLGVISFASKVDFTTGTNPNSISIGDIDGDGKPDLAVANENSSSVSVLLNTSSPGTINFATKVDFITTGPVIYSVSLGDIDGDGKPDMAVANTTSNSVSVFLNTSTVGSISFAAKIDFTTGTSPESISIGDIDGDGKPDLIVANDDSYSVSVFRNTSTVGAISLAAKVDFTTGTHPYAVSIGDIDGDGKPDLTTANYGSNSVSVLRNTSTTGAISFATKVDLTTGSTPYGVCVGDLDADGKPDIAVANTYATSVSVFHSAPKIPPVISSFSPLSGVVGTTVTITGTSFNTNPANNIVFFGATQANVSAATATSLTVTVPIGTTYQYISVTNLALNLTAYSAKPFIVTLAGNIAFTNKQDLATGTQPYLVNISDIDGDGKPDLVVANGVSNSISVFLNTSTSGTVSFAARVDLATGTSPESASIGDIDGDGKPDLVVANNGSNTISVFRNTSTIGNVSFAANVDFTTGVNPTPVSIGDLDGDGKPDLAVPNYGSNTVSIFRNTSNVGTISFAAKVDITTGVNPIPASIGDIDGDGKPDLVLANHGSNTVSVFRNTSIIGTLSFETKVDFTTGGSGSGDPDNAPIDGGLSLLIAGGIGYAAKKIKEKRQKRKL